MGDRRLPHRGRVQFGSPTRKQIAGLARFLVAVPSFVLVPFVTLARIARSNSSKLTARAEQIAAAAHVDAQHIIALLSQIRNQQVAPPKLVPSDPAGS
jgi:hypothetical protein